MLARRRRILPVTALLIAALSAPAPAAEGQAKLNAASRGQVQAAYRHPAGGNKIGYVAGYPRFHWLFQRWRCVHLGCEGVHTIGVGY